MLLKLVNFGVHESLEIEIPDNGLILLQGESGTGKSTILQSLLYVFYGGVRKPYTHGKKTCSVKVTIGDASIFRSSSPNRVIFKKDGEKYEDCQDEIDKFLGLTRDEFIASSYARQAFSTSILSMSPADRLKFIEKTMSSNGEYDKVKGMCITKIKSLKTKFIETSTAIKLNNKNLQKEEEKLEDIGGYDPSLKLNAEYIEEKYDKLVKKRKRVASKKESIQAKIETNKAVLTSHKSKMEVVDALNEQIDELNGQIKSLEKHTLERGQLLEAEKLALEKQVECVMELNRYQNLVDDTIKLEKQLQKLKKQLKPCVGEYNEHASTVISTDVQASQLEKAKGMYAKIVDAPDIAQITATLKENDTKFEVSTSEELRDYITEKINSLESGECPECHCKLYTDDSHGDTDDFHKKYITFKPKFSETEIKDADILKDMLDCVKGTNDIHITKDIASRQIKLIGNVKRLQSQIAIAEQNIETMHISQLKMKEKLPVDENTGTDPVSRLSDVKMKIRVNNRAITDRESLNRRVRVLDSKKPELNHLFDEDEIVSTIESLRADLAEVKRNESEIDDQFSEINKERRALKSYEEAKSLYKRVKEIKDSISDLDKRKESINSKLTKYEELLDLTKLTFSKSIELMINNINVHASSYLSQFFEDPITLKLIINKKTQIVTKLVYKSHEYDSLAQLSGGEAQRCELAFLLAVNDINSSRFLILDECMNSLDADINSSIFRKIKKLIHSSKLVLVVSHEAVSGIFDEIIDVKTIK